MAAFGWLRSRVRLAAALSIAVSSLTRAAGRGCGAASIALRSRVAVSVIALWKAFLMPSDSGLIVAFVGLTGAGGDDSLAKRSMNSTPLTIRPVETKTDRQAFVDFAWE